MSEHLPPLCRINDILPILPIKRSTVWQWVREGKFPAPIQLGRLRVWKRDDIRAWLKLDKRDE